MGRIFIKSPNGFEPLDESSYSEEDKFQEFLFENPHVMGIADDEGNLIRMIPVAREVPVSDEAGSSFSIDLVCLDGSGLVNIVEVKRCSDTRIRREVVGQIFDYASQLCFSTEVASLQAAFESKYAGNDLNAILSYSLGTELSYDKFWEAVKTNLQARKVRLIIAADGIPENLKRIIEFLNSQMDPAELVGVDLRKFGKGDMEIYTSTIIGNTEESEAKKKVGRPSKQWDRSSFLSDVENQSGPEVKKAALKLLQWCEARKLRIWYGKGFTEASFISVYDRGESENSLFGVYSKGKFYFQFQYLRPPFDTPEWRRMIMESFNEVLNQQLGIEDMARRPSFTLSDYDEATLSRLLAKFDWLIEQIDKNQSNGGYR